MVMDLWSEGAIICHLFIVWSIVFHLQPWKVGPIVLDRAAGSKAWLSPLQWLLDDDNVDDIYK